MPQPTPDARKRDIDIYSEEVITIGKSIYQKDILPRVTDADNDKMVVIDVYSGDYEIDHDSIVARLRLKRRQPDAIVYIGRVGSPTAYRNPGMRYAVDIRPRHPNP